MAVWGLKNADVSTFIQNVSTFRSLAVLVLLKHTLHFGTNFLAGLFGGVAFGGVFLDGLINYLFSGQPVSNTGHQPAQWEN